MAVDYQATEKLQLNANVIYSNAEDSWDWDFADRPTLIFTNMTGVVAGPNTGYDTTAQNNNIDSYSDLSYEQYELTLGGTYNINDHCYTTASFTYDKFESDQMYVYGDEDGDALSGYVGFGYRF